MAPVSPVSPVLPGVIGGDRLERGGIALGVLLVFALPVALHGWPTSLRGTLFVLLVLGGGWALVWWRSHPRAASVASLGLLATALAVGGWFPDSAVVLFSLAFAVLALAWSGRAAWVVALCAAACLVPFSYLSGGSNEVPTFLFTLPPFAAGTALRLRRETADALTARARELEEERELYAEIALRHERARIASELHDIVGHAISVMVIQAAAGQRLVDVDPARAREAFGAIAASARRGTEDLERLVALLDGPDDGAADGVPDLALVDEVVTVAGRSGLRVTCCVDGDRDEVPPPVAHLAFRVVQEGLTNALRYAPGAEVRIVLRIDPSGRGLSVRVENDRAAASGQVVVGTGRGLVGLRERIQALGGQLSAGATRAGGWTVEARLPGG